MKDIIEKGSILIINSEILERCRPNVKIEVEIRCLKQEAMDNDSESGASDDETKKNEKAFSPRHQV